MVNNKEFLELINFSYMDCGIVVDLEGKTCTRDLHSDLAEFAVRVIQFWKP